MARFVYIFSAACQIEGSLEYREATEHGLRFLQEYQWDHEHGGYYWVLKRKHAENRTKYAYGQALPS